MRLLRLFTIVIALAAVGSVSAPVYADELARLEQPQPPKEFVPVDEAPPGEQIPAINLVAAAYGFVWLAVLGYAWSIARRLKTVEAELAQLESKKR